MTNFTKLAGAAALASIALAGAARAEDEKPSFSWSFNIGATSDYMFRGFSQRDDKPALQGGLDIGYGIWYAGIWSSNTADGYVATDREVDLYTGIKPVWDKVTFDFGVIYYGYPNQKSSLARNFLSGDIVNVDYWEFKAGASTSPVDKLTTSLTYFYSPDYSFEAGPSHTIEGTVAYELPAVGIFTPTISGTLGYQKFDEAITIEQDGKLLDNIVYWNAGLALAVEKITLDFRYWGSNKDVNLPGVTSTDDRFVFSVKATLGSE